MTVPLRIGMGNRYGVRVTVAMSTDFDPTLPDGAILKVTKPDGTTIDWVGVIENQSSSSATAFYQFNADCSDLDQDGLWRVWVQWTEADVPGARSESGSFPVIAADQL